MIVDFEILRADYIFQIVYYLKSVLRFCNIIMPTKKAHVPAILQHNAGFSLFHSSLKHLRKSQKDVVFWNVCLS